MIQEATESPKYERERSENTPPRDMKLEESDSIRDSELDMLDDQDQDQEQNQIKD